MWHCRVEGGFFCISWLFLLSNRSFLLRQGQEPVSNCGTNYRTSLLEQEERQDCLGPLSALLDFSQAWRLW